MKKIPTIFKRNPDNMGQLLPEQHPDCGWVFNGEGIATKKFDGTCCLVENSILYKRREIKKGKPIPQNFKKADTDGITGKTVGWVPVDPKNNDDKWHLEAFASDMDDGTYELIGPKIQGNPETINFHYLLKHSEAKQYKSVPRTFEGLREWLEDKDIEGIVFHHADGRMAKIKKRDFGQKRTD